MLKSVRLSTVLLAVSLAASICVLTGCHQVQPNGVVATVNGHPILQADLDKVYKAQLANNPQQQSPSADQEASLRLNILHELIVEEIVEQRAAKLNLTATDAEVDAKLNELRLPTPTNSFARSCRRAGRRLIACAAICAAASPSTSC